MDYYHELTEKWGQFKKNDHWLEQVDTTFISNKAKLNLLFEPIEQEEIKRRFHNHFGVFPPRFLLDFYKNTNGCRLFSNSLCIYGFQAYPSETFEPFDIVKETERVFSQHRFDQPLVFFGALGGQYLFCFSLLDPNRIIIINADSFKRVKEFNGFEKCFETIFRNLLDEYDLLGKKKHINKRFRNIPILANLSFEKRFLEE